MLLLDRDTVGVFYSPSQLSIFSIENNKNISIWPIDETLKVPPLQIRVDLEVMAMKGYTKFPNGSRLESPHQMQFSVISRALVGGSSILQPLPSGLLYIINCSEFLYRIYLLVIREFVT